MDDLPSVESMTAFIQAYEGGLYAIIVSVVRLQSSETRPRGLTSAEISRATESVLFTDSATCSICIASHARKGSVKLRCGHCYHRQCISTWLERAQTCPLCRERVIDAGD